MLIYNNVNKILPACNQALYADTKNHFKKQKSALSKELSFYGFPLHAIYLYKTKLSDFLLVMLHPLVLY